MLASRQYHNGSWFWLKQRLLKCGVEMAFTNRRNPRGLSAGAVLHCDAAGSPCGVSAQRFPVKNRFPSLSSQRWNKGGGALSVEVWSEIKCRWGRAVPGGYFRWQKLQSTRLDAKNGIPCGKALRRLQLKELMEAEGWKWKAERGALGFKTSFAARVDLWKFPLPYHPPVVFTSVPHMSQSHTCLCVGLTYAWEWFFSICQRQNRRKDIYFIVSLYRWFWKMRIWFYEKISRGRCVWK